MPEKINGAEHIRLIPNLSRVNSNCLTVTNWQEVGINTFCYYLDDLLVKPGLDILKGISNLKNYLGLPTELSLVINATGLINYALGKFYIRSQFDGSTLIVTNTEIINLLNHLLPNELIVPLSLSNAVFCQSLSAQIKLFLPGNSSVSFRDPPIFSAHEKPLRDFSYRQNHSYERCSQPGKQQSEAQDPQRLFKSYKNVGIHERASNNRRIWHEQSTQSFAQFLQQITQNLPAQEIYLFGDFSYAAQIELSKYNIGFIESARYAQDAKDGIIYTKDHSLNLTAESHATEHVVLDAQCQCPTCKEGFTRAYLHHLHEHVPLLCQRFLLQHNIYYLRCFIYHANIGKF